MQAIQADREADANHLHAKIERCAAAAHGGAALNLALSVTLSVTSCLALSLVMNLALSLTLILALTLIQAATTSHGGTCCRHNAWAPATVCGEP